MALPSVDYTPRDPAADVLHRVVREHLQAFRAEAAPARECGLPDVRRGDRPAIPTPLRIVRAAGAPGFGGALNLNVHIHAPVDVLAALAPGVQRALARRGGDPEDAHDGSDAFADASPQVRQGVSDRGGPALHARHARWRVRPARRGPMCASWNHLDAWLRQVDSLRRAA